MKQTIIKIMKKKQPKWKPIKMGERLPCQSFLRKKSGEILKLSTVAGVKVGQDAYYLPVDDVIEEIKNYPIEESEDEMICRKLIAFLKQCKAVYGEGFKQFDLNIDDAIAWLEQQCEQKVEPKSYASETMNEKGDFDDGFTRMMEKEQKLAEWREEDERLFQIIIDILDKEEHEGRLSHTDLIACVRKLKSLRPQSHWKPSKEQIEVLDEVIRNPHLSTAEYNGLIALKEQLKALHRYEQDT